VKLLVFLQRRLDISRLVQIEIQVECSRVTLDVTRNMQSIKESRESLGDGLREEQRTTREGV
jgi:hypothetical protein